MMKVELVKGELSSNKKKTVYTIDDLYATVSRIYKKQVVDLQNVYYMEFYNLIKELENSGVIKKHGDGKTYVNPHLFKKYKVLRDKIVFTEEEKINMAKLNKVNLGYYGKRVDEFREDYDIIVALNDLLRDTTHYREITLNEISYIMFGYEKDMSEGKVSVVMKKLGIKEEDLGCRMKNEPLLNTIFKGFYEKDRRNILIAENLETYWSLNKILREISNDIDMLIWGQGCSVESNFRGTILYGVNENDSIYYFGDIDLSGVDIFLRLKSNFKDFSIMPSTSLYKNLLNIGMKMGIKKSRSQKQIDIEEDRLNIFLNAFSNEVRDKLKAIIKNREYIPQEALNYNELRKAYGNE
ncbi:hypothetical protein B9W14_08030 [Clostridium drakei]|uniref:Wadjet protein JetD C-terminal domain-containing protein n=2 Tax=Clostridium TaxID=1485 RepID=A0A2U8DP30_9CLOT|nr:Wadjet anti-phage system protein JetD domain-containing protein [Clostridium drakei]AWI04443.1 hypothetical protein B9W14_08030 [Clostridium drakei]